MFQQNAPIERTEKKRVFKVIDPTLSALVVADRIAREVPPENVSLPGRLALVPTGVNFEG